PGGRGPAAPRPLAAHRRGRSPPVAGGGLRTGAAQARGAGPPGQDREQEPRAAGGGVGRGAAARGEVAAHAHRRQDGDRAQREEEVAGKGYSPLVATASLLKPAARAFSITVTTLP